VIWQTRTLAQFIAASVPVEAEGATNELMDAARSVGRAIGKKDAAEATNELVGAASKPIEPKAGSYEAFMATFARAMR
jgi:hypothetical protein